MSFLPEGVQCPVVFVPFGEHVEGIKSAADVFDRFGGEVAVRRNIARRRAASLSSVENSSAIKIAPVGATLLSPPRIADRRPLRVTTDR